ncbi:MAG: protein-glutamate O-methyltransferase CheR [Pseudomonadota bacterium]
MIARAASRRTAETEAPADPCTEVTESDLARFAEFFHKRTGITFPPHRSALVRKRLGDCIVEYGAASFRDLFLRLRTRPGGPEMQSVINALTVNETFFYREAHQFDQLVKHALPQVTARRPANRPVRILSMPCSTGEEPYSIAIYLLENWPDVDRFDVEIIGTDIDTDAITKARQARYGSRSVSRLPQSALKRYFRLSSGAAGYQLVPGVADAVQLAPSNLLDREIARQFKAIDVVFCRNLLIYFDDSARSVAMNNLYDCLRPGGYIFVGHSESISRMTSLFEPQRVGEHMLHRKPMRARSVT